MRVLVVEDDRLLNNSLCYNLDSAGYVADSAFSKGQAEELFRTGEYGLVVLDVNLPDGSGFDFCRWVKAEDPETAVVFLTANDMERDMLKGFELGADDYVAKPFPIRVLLKKIAALTARMEKQGTGDCYEDGNLVIDFAGMRAFLAGEPLTFTGMEYRLLNLLVKNPQTVMTRRVLLEKLWDVHGNFVEEHALTVAV